MHIPGVPGGKVSTLGGHSTGHSKQKSLYVRVCYSELFPRYSCLARIKERQDATRHVLALAAKCIDFDGGIFENFITPSKLYPLSEQLQFTIKHNTFIFNTATCFGLYRHRQQCIRGTKCQNIKT
jgi:hypothetical protein